MNPDVLVVHGLDLSYFTGKLEAGLRAKGLPYRLQQMDTRSFRALGARTGVLQMPHLELPTGELLTDSGAILDRLEADGTGAPLTPADPATAFVDRLLEVWADEWLWRPALHYRWSFEADSTLMAGRIADGMLRDVPLPLALRRRAMLWRQRRVYLRRDGVTRATRAAVEALYLNTLEALEPVLASRRFLLGERPTRADVGLMGPFFRHFASDPTPLGLMRARAPHVHAWVGRMWAVSPDRLAAVPLPEHPPADLQPLAQSITAEFLPYLQANAASVEQPGRVDFTSHGARFSVPYSRFRAGRLGLLQNLYARLPADARNTVDQWLGNPGALALPPIALPPVPRVADRALAAV